MTNRRILFVHAHPDDETISTGAAIARYAAEGANVTLLTCTLGEEGEIHVPALAQLAANDADQLGGYRFTELTTACHALGVEDYRLLGGTGRYRDSGMMGTDANENPRSFWQADVAEAGRYVADVIDELHPHVLVTYDPNGQYGHPDHIQAHRAAMAGVEQAEWEVPKIYYTAFPRSVAAQGLEQFRSSSDNPFADAKTVDDIPFLTPDEDVTTRIDARRFLDAKRTAIQMHATQIPKDSWVYTWATGFGDDTSEYFVLIRGEKGPVGQDGFENDLFGGLE